MIRHCVMFKWKPETSEETKAQIFAGLDELARMDCVSGYHHGPDAGLREGNWDYVAVGDFDTVDDYKTYRDDADHQELVKILGAAVSDRAGSQYFL